MDHSFFFFSSVRGDGSAREKNLGGPCAVMDAFYHQHQHQYQFLGVFFCFMTLIFFILTAPRAAEVGWGGMGSCASRAGRAREPGSGPETVRPFPPPPRARAQTPWQPFPPLAPPPPHLSARDSCARPTRGSAQACFFPLPPPFFFLLPMARRPRVSSGVPAGRWPGGGRAEGRGWVGEVSFLPGPASGPRLT